jgi:hypothetical protein
MVNLLKKKYSSGVTVVPALEEHISHIASNLREADSIEVALMSNQPYESMSMAIEFDTQTFTLLSKDKTPCAMFGSGDWRQDEGYIWMLATDEVMDYWRDFLRFSRPWINKLTTHYPKYSNLVHKENHVSLRWLLWCGARLEREVEIEGETFYYFSIYNFN